MKKSILFFLLLLAFIPPVISKQKVETKNDYNIIPQPNLLIPARGCFVFSNQTKIIIPKNAPEIRAIADSFATRIKNTTGLQLAEVQHTPQKGYISFLYSKKLPKEGYELFISPTHIIIKASQPNGFFYGIQTIYQLLPPQVYGKALATQENWSIPAVKIKDMPRFSYRGLMLDCCRHFVSVDYIYKFIDQLAIHKMNTFHWHLTDDQGWRIEIKKYPKLTEIGSQRKETMVGYYYENYPFIYDGKNEGGYYTQEQIKDIVAYAKSKYITIIPEIEMPGHSIAALATYPELSCNPSKKYETGEIWGVYDDVYCPSETTFKFLENVLDEVIELFPSKYIHIGGDECPKEAWINSIFCQNLIKKLELKDDSIPNKIDGRKHSKEEKLQSYFITRIEKYLNSKGRNIIGWDEILEGGLAPNATVMSWRGISGGINAAKGGHNAIMTPGGYVYLDAYQEDPEIAPTTIGGYTTLRRTYSYNPVPDNIADSIKKHIIGIQGNIWREYMASNTKTDYQAFPRAIAIAETGWTEKENKNFDSFCKRMVKEFQRLNFVGIKACSNFYNVNINTHAEKDGPLKVFMETYYPGAEIHYTTNGNNPTTSSTLYATPFELKGNMDLRAAAFKNGKILGQIYHKPLYGNLISGKPFTTNLLMGLTGDIFGENDSWGGDKTTFGLTNGKRGNNASYLPWSGFDMTKNQVLEITINLGQPTKIQKVIFGSLFNPAMKILPAGAISIESSTDGKQYQEIASKKLLHLYPERGRKAFTDSIIFHPVNASYIKVCIKNGGKLKKGIDFNPDNGPKIVEAYLYLDEIEVY